MQHLHRPLLLLLLLGVAARLVAADSATTLPSPDSVTPPVANPGDDSLLDILEGGRRPWELTAKLAAYSQQDDGGIEQVDEDASVFEAVIFAEKQMTESGTLNVRLLGDVVSAASIERNHNASWRAQQGGASGNFRVGVDVGWSQQQTDDWTWSGGASVATEYAYTSLGLRAGSTWSLNQKNTDLSLGLQAYADTVETIRFDGSQDEDEDRTTLTTELGLTQILTPRSLLNATLSLTSQSGYLQTSYNSVFVNDVEYSEELPDSRFRYALTLRYKQAIGQEDAVEVGGRYYGDDWGIAAETLELRYFHYLWDRRLLLEPTYRLHLQSAADDYRESFTSLPEFRTSDPDLGDFTGHLLGLRSTFIDRQLFGLRADYDIGVEYYTRDNGLDMFWLTLGLSTRF